MKLYSNKWLKTATLMFGAASLLVACNKELPDAVPNEMPVSSGQSITEILNDPDYLFLKTAVERAAPDSRTGYTPLSTLFSNKDNAFTFFAPNNNAFRPLFPAGTPDAAIIAALKSNNFTPGRLDSLIRYHLIGGNKMASANFSTAFPNTQLPTALVLAPPSTAVPPGLRMPIFPSNRNGLWVNNIPIIQADVMAANGVVHKTAAIVLPPTQFLWNRIDTATDLTYIKAAIKRADEGVAAGSRLEDILMNPGANLTVFAPTDAAFKQALTLQIAAYLMSQVPGMDQATAVAQATALAASPDLFKNPAVANVLTPETVKGIVVYHILGTRAFSVNFPTSVENKPTLLNTAIASHPGVGLQATFGARGVTAASVKGAANPTASNILINPTPSAGTSDQHYINGVLHKIDQVLRPQ